MQMDTFGLSGCINSSVVTRLTPLFSLWISPKCGVVHWATRSCSRVLLDFIFKVRLKDEITSNIKTFVAVFNQMCNPSLSKSPYSWNESHKHLLFSDPLVPYCAYSRALCLITCNQLHIGHLSLGKQTRERGHAGAESRIGMPGSQSTWIIVQTHGLCFLCVCLLVSIMTSFKHRDITRAQPEMDLLKPLIRTPLM